MASFVASESAANQLGSEKRKLGKLRVLSPYLFLLDPPDSGHRFMPRSDSVNVDEDPVKPGQNADMDRILPQLPPGTCAYRSFVDDWNAFLYLAASGVEFSWDDGQE